VGTLMFCFCRWRRHVSYHAKATSLSILSFVGLRTFSDCDLIKINRLPSLLIFALFLLRLRVVNFRIVCVSDLPRICHSTLDVAAYFVLDFGLLGRGALRMEFGREFFR
jgi:hypothetical protein